VLHQLSRSQQQEQQLHHSHKQSSSLHAPSATPRSLWFRALPREYLTRLFLCLSGALHMHAVG
jgi:hypothetical protein